MVPAGRPGMPRSVPAASCDAYGRGGDEPPCAHGNVVVLSVPLPLPRRGGTRAHSSSTRRTNCDANAVWDVKMRPVT
jgi:hypothetical protein